MTRCCPARSGGQAGVDEVVEAAELAQTVLAAEFVAARHAAFAVAVAQPVEPHCVDLVGGRVQPRQREVLQALRRVLQAQLAQARVWIFAISTAMTRCATSNSSPLSRPGGGLQRSHAPGCAGPNRPPGVAFAWARKALTTALCSRAKNRVMKTQADAPVVRESGGFLAGPLR